MFRETRVLTGPSQTQQTRNRLVGDMGKIFKQKKFGQNSNDFVLFDLLDSHQQMLETQIKEEQRRAELKRALVENYHTAWLDYMRHGYRQTPQERGMSESNRALLLKGERRDMIEGTGGATPGGAYPGATSGFFAPVDFSGKVEAAMKYTAPMLDVCSFIDTTNGSPLGYPTDSDINTIGEQVPENGQVTETDVPLGQATFTTYKYSSRMVKVSMELLQDTGFDLEAYLAEKFAYRIGRVLNPLLANGSGSGCPKGLLTGLTVGVGPSTTPAVIGNDNLTTPDPTQQVGFLDVVNLENSLDPVYRIGASYMLHPNTLSYIRTLKDTVGRPLDLWKPFGGPFGSINGYPVFPNPDFPQLAAGNKTVAFGRLDKYFVRRGPMWVRRISERYIDYGQIGFLCFARRDGLLIDSGTHPVVCLQQHS